MKRKFSKSWKASKQPRKQRKYLANAPLHIKRKSLSVNLSKELRKKIGKRNIVVRKDDVVKIMRGDFYGKQGKVMEVFTKNRKVIIDGINVKKRDGSKANVKIRTSNLQIIQIADRGNIQQEPKVKEEEKQEKISPTKKKTKEENRK